METIRTDGKVFKNLVKYFAYLLKVLSDGRLTLFLSTELTCFMTSFIEKVKTFEYCLKHNVTSVQNPLIEQLLLFIMNGKKYFDDGYISDDVCNQIILLHDTYKWNKVKVTQKVPFLVINDINCASIAEFTALETYVLGAITLKNKQLNFHEIAHLEQEERELIIRKLMTSSPDLLITLVLSDNKNELFVTFYAPYE